MPDLTHAIIALYPNSSWVLTGSSYQGLDWKDTSIPKPTEEELNSKLQELLLEEPLKQLRQLRNKLLLESDKYTLVDWPHKTDTVREEWLSYRQQLRDLPSNSTPSLTNGSLNMDSFTLPTKPTEKPTTEPTTETTTETTT
jgi:hypothetical protein